MRQRLLLETVRDRTVGAPEPAGSDIFDDLDWTEIAALLRLSGRELEIARCVVSDDPESVIAARLGISKHTVHSHLERVYRKIGVNSRLRLVVKVFATHLRAARRASSERVRMSSTQGTA